MLKIVIDTNLLIDGAADDYNYGNRIIDAVMDGKIEAYANTATLRENRLLSERKISDPDYLAKLTEYFNCVRSAPRVQERIRIVSDPEDNKLVESAVAAGAEYIVSSDHHLLDIKEYQGVKIVTPAEFWYWYQDQTQDSWNEWIGKFIGN